MKKIILVFFLTIILSEFTLRTYYFQINALSKIALVDIFKILSNKKNSFTKFDGITHIRYRAYPPFYKEKDNSVPFLLRTDSNGFIFPVNYYENPDIKIVFLGGSTTECKYVDEKLRFPFLTGEIIENKTNLKATTINSGVCGSNTMHSVNLLLNKIIPLKPDYVVLMHNVNDWSTLGMEGTYWNENISLSLTYKDHRRAWFIDEDEFNDIRNKKPISNIHQMKLDYEKALKTFVAICKANDIEPILMTQAHRFVEFPDSGDIVYKSFINALSEFNIKYDDVVLYQVEFNDIIRNVALETNTKLIDLDSQLSYADDYIYDLVHYNNEGSKKVAEIIAAYFCSFLF